MDLDLSDEQRALFETVNALLAKRYEPGARAALMESELGWSRETWAQYADMGLLGLSIAEEYGGAGMGGDELSVVMESCGRALALEPYFATAVLGAGLVTAAGTPQQRANILPEVCAGRMVLTFASAEPGTGWSLSELATTATPTAGGWRIRGQKIAVPAGDSADLLIVSARIDGGGVGLFLVGGGDVQCDSYLTQDGFRAADLLFSDAAGTLLGSPEDSVEAVAGVVDIAMIALCAETVGLMDRMLAMTLEYLGTREQFGRRLAQFQALQFRATELLVAVEQSRSMLVLARLALRRQDGADRRQIIRAAKAHADRSARLVGQEAIQLHGGIGMTMEHPIGHYVKRATVIARTFTRGIELVSEIGANGGLIRQSDYA
jgi:alkylation response protein AidB-like acyl-CoA dehydrogenase